MKFNLSSIEHKLLASEKERFSFSAVISELAGFKDVFIHHEIIPPKRKASSPHYHSHREEMVFVVEGSPTPYKGKSRINLSKGDFIFFLPNKKDAHFIENNTIFDVKILVICSNPSHDKVIYCNNNMNRRPIRIKKDQPSISEQFAFDYE